MEIMFYWGYQDSENIKMKNYDCTAIFVSVLEHTNGNNIEAISFSLVYKNALNIQLEKQPECLTLNKKYNSLWIGKLNDTDNCEIVWKPDTKMELNK